MKKALLPEEIYQKLTDKELTKEQAVILLNELNYFEVNSNLQKKIYEAVKRLGIDFYYGKNYLNEGVVKEDAQVLGLLEATLGIPFKQVTPDSFMLCSENYYYTINKFGHIINLMIDGYINPKLWFFPEEICSLAHIERLDFSYNSLTSLPIKLKTLPYLESIRLQNESDLFYLDNILEYIDLNEFEEKITLEKIEERMDEKLKILESAESEQWNFNNQPKKYPPMDILKTENHEYILLWTIYNNGTCTWKDFTIKSLNLPDPILVHYLRILIRYRYIERKKIESLQKTLYRLTPLGINKLKEIEKDVSYFSQ